MRRRAYIPAALAALAVAGCTEVATDPNAVVALLFDGAEYPSIVLGDSLRDSLGTVQPVRVTALNYRNDPVSGVEALFASPDTALVVEEDGVVFARTPKTDGPARIFATVGALQTAPDSLFIVPRADSIAATKDVDTRPAGATVVPDTTFPFTVRGRAEDQTVVPVGPWLVSFQLRFHGRLLAPTDTTAAYSFTGTDPTRPNRAWVDTTDAQGIVRRGLKVTCDSLAAGLDSVILIGTIRDRRSAVARKSAQTIVRFQRPAVCP